ncbi:zinc finger protein sens-like [Belonocnema kinseyi]|uniref:zinc finger protein sens-like n=1 Tax=Belonocnema kinseyi TaxID=2817044 RepID=UPI00143D6ADE|nr:zinc finger protein sens-like [Belonocnema kinseyi]
MQQPPKRMGVIEYDNGQSLVIKEEIIQDEVLRTPDMRKDDILVNGKIGYSKEAENSTIKAENQPSPSNNTKNLKSDSKQSTERLDGRLRSALQSGPLLEFETVFVKHEREDSSLFSDGNPFDETIQDQVVCTPDLTQDDILVVGKKVRGQKKQKIQASRQEPGKKYKCEKCARTYSRIYSLNQHRKYECDVTPKFTCSFCGKLFKRKNQMNTHVSLVHLKTNLHGSQTKINCDKCSKSYTWQGDLNRHKRLEHAEITRQFTCDICNHKAKRKYHLSKHITSKHLNK